MRSSLRWSGVYSHGRISFSEFRFVREQNAQRIIGQLPTECGALLWLVYPLLHPQFGRNNLMVFRNIRHIPVSSL